MLYPVFDFSVYSIKTPIKNIKHFLFDLKCCRDRIRKGYCGKDAWDMDLWFLEVVPGVPDLLREHMDSYPSSLLDEYYQDHSDISHEDDASEDTNGLVHWKNILKEMSDLFRTAGEGYTDYCPDEKAVAARERAMTLLNRYFDDLWN